jgi:uncharacterized protein
MDNLGKNKNSVNDFGMEDGGMNNKTISGMKCILYLFGLLALALPAQAASFDCAKASTKIEKIICGSSNVSSVDEDVELAYLRALERTEDRQKLMQDQRNWLKNVRNACPDADCLFKAYAIREGDLDAIPTHKCYWLEPPRKDSAGKRPPVEPICHAMEANLNQFCDQPPMVCGLKIAPKFSQQLTLPSWVPLDLEANRALIKEFVHAPDEGRKNQYSEALWVEKQSQLDAAFAKGHITFAQAQLDLYNLGKPQTAYRLDYGNCQADNPQLKDTAQWGMAIHHAEVITQHAPEIVRSLFKEYFPLQSGSLNEVFLYEGKVYDYIIGGVVNQATGLGENQMVVNRHEQKTYKGESRPTLEMNNICIFNYQPVLEVTK